MIKSEKAKKFIQNKITNACDPRYVGHRYTMMLGRNNAFKAVKIAEADARERAVRAFRGSCNARYRVNCGHGDLQGILMCPEGQDCRSDCALLAEFLKNYDNE